LPAGQWEVEALLERTRCKPNMANRVDETTEQAVINYAIEFPAYGQTRTSNELRKAGVFVSPSGVRSIWLRHDLENFIKRLKALEAKVANDNGIILTEAQVQALEKKKHDDEACGEIETQHPGYLGSQDTFYVGTLKGVGRVYQQTYIDTYSKVAHTKLYTTKTPIRTAPLALIHQIIMKLAVAIYFTTFFPSLFDKFCLTDVFLGPIAQRVLHPRVKTTGVNTQHLTHHAGLEAILIGCYEGVLHFVFFAKYAAAFFKISRSSVTRLSSRFKRLISAA